MALLSFLVALAAVPPLPPPDAAWQLVKITDGITVRSAPSERAAPWGSAEALIAAPPEKILAHLIAFEAQVGLVPRLERVRVLRRAEGEAVVYFYFDLPWPIANRDYTARYRWQRNESGAIRIVVDDAEALGPPAGDAVRVHFLRGVWELRPVSDGKTQARYVWLAEFGGSLTRGMIEQTAWKQPLETVRGVRAAVEPKR